MRTISFREGNHSKTNYKKVNLNSQPPVVLPGWPLPSNRTTFCTSRVTSWELRQTTPLRDLLTMVINHLLTGMILQDYGHPKRKFICQALIFRVIVSSIKVNLLDISQQILGRIQFPNVWSLAMGWVRTKHCFLMLFDTMIISALYYIIKPFSKYWEPTINLNLLQPLDFEKNNQLRFMELVRYIYLRIYDTNRPFM